MVNVNQQRIDILFANPWISRQGHGLYLALKKRFASSSQSRFASHVLCMYFHRTRTLKARRLAQ
jgi:hypothetical protein